MRAVVLSWGIGDEQPYAPESERKAPARRNASTRRVASLLRERWSRGASPLRKPASGTLTEGGDVKQAPGDSLSGPTAESRDAQPDAQPPSPSE